MREVRRDEKVCSRAPACFEVRKSRTVDMFDVFHVFDTFDMTDTFGLFDMFGVKYHATARSTTYQ